MQKDQLPQLVLLTLLTVGLSFTVMELKNQGQVLEVISSRLAQETETDSDLAGGTMLAGQELPPGSEGLIGGDAMPPGEEPASLPELSTRQSVELRSIEYRFEVPEGIEVEHGDAGGYSQTSFTRGEETVFYIGTWSATLDAFSPESRDATFDEFLEDRGYAKTGETMTVAGRTFHEVVSSENAFSFMTYLEENELWPTVIQLPSPEVGDSAGNQIRTSLEFTLR